jgi:hypothetical protein
MTVTVTFAPDAPGNYGEELPITRTPERGATGLVCKGTARSAPPPGPEIINVPASDVGALIAAIDKANQTPAAGAIVLGPGTYTLSATQIFQADGLNGLPSITSPMTIKVAGNGATIKRDANMPFRIFHVASTAALTLDGLTIMGGHAMVDGAPLSGTGGGILSLLHFPLPDKPRQNSRYIYG